MTAAESMLALAIVAVPILLVYAFAVFDLLRRPLRVWRKVAWAAAILLIPGIGVFAYYVMRPVKGPGTHLTDPGGLIESLGSLRLQWEAGELDDASYLQAKRRLFRV